MHVTLVHVHVGPEFVAPFLAATLRNHEGSVQEPGCVRFDVLQSIGDPTRFTLFEVFRDDAAAAAHKNTPHYLAWRDEVKDWMASPREGRRQQIVSPAPIA